MIIKYNYNRKVFIWFLLFALVWLINLDYSIMGIFFLGVIFVIFILLSLIGGWVTAIESQRDRNLLVIHRLSIKGRKKLKVYVSEDVRAKIVKITASRGGKRFEFVLYSGQQVIYSSIIDQMGFSKRDFIRICSDLSVPLEE